MEQIMFIQRSNFRNSLRGLDTMDKQFAREETLDEIVTALLDDAGAFDAGLEDLEAEFGGVVEQCTGVETDAEEDFVWVDM